jgi:hypothetical protein
MPTKIGLGVTSVLSQIRVPYSKCRNIELSKCRNVEGAEEVRTSS